MHSYISKSAPTCDFLAEALLQAWIIGDRGRLRSELENSSSTDIPAEDGCEEERLLLLRAIADRIKRCPDPFVSRCVDPGLDLCLDLLTHLVGGRCYTHGNASLQN